MRVPGSLGRLSRERLASVVGNIVDILCRDAAVLKRSHHFRCESFFLRTVFYFLFFLGRYEPNLRDAGLWTEEKCSPVVPLSATNANAEQYNRT